MLEMAARVVLAGVLVGAAVAKLARPTRSQAALATFGFADPRTRRVAWGVLITAEAGLGAAVATGSDSAAYAAAALLGVFAATMISALMRGHAGEPCGCFGPASRVSWLAVARNGVLATAFALLPRLEPQPLSGEQWLGLGLLGLLVATLALAGVVLALAREVGMLRLRLGPGSALEVAGEGPRLGAQSSLIVRFRFDRSESLAVAVFTSEGCHVCRALEPAIDSIAAEPVVSVVRFSEQLEPGVWEQEGIPGSPYVVVLDRVGTVLAKGTFNNLAQLESVLAAAERRMAAAVPGMAPARAADSGA